MQAKNQAKKQVKKIVMLTAASLIAVASCAHAATATDNATASATAKAEVDQAHLLMWSVDSDGPDFRALVTGAVGDYGPGVAVRPDGTVDPEHSSEVRLNLTHGSFRLSIATIDKEILQAYQHWPSNPATCSGTITVTAAAPIVAGSGTGAYRGITGSFSVAVTIDEVDAKPVCDGTSRFLSQLILFDGTGRVWY